MQNSTATPSYVRYMYTWGEGSTMEGEFTGALVDPWEQRKRSNCSVPLAFCHSSTMHRMSMTFPHSPHSHGQGWHAGAAHRVRAANCGVHVPGARSAQWRESSAVRVEL
jgi:hypothetical protein